MNQTEVQSRPSLGDYRRALFLSGECTAREAAAWTTLNTLFRVARVAAPFALPAAIAAVDLLSAQVVHAAYTSASPPDCPTGFAPTTVGPADGQLPACYDRETGLLQVLVPPDRSLLVSLYDYCRGAAECIRDTLTRNTTSLAQDRVGVDLGTGDHVRLTVTDADGDGSVIFSMPPGYNSAAIRLLSFPGSAERPPVTIPERHDLWQTIGTLAAVTGLGGLFIWLFLRDPGETKRTARPAQAQPLAPPADHPAHAEVPRPQQTTTPAAKLQKMGLQGQQRIADFVDATFNSYHLPGSSMIMKGGNSGPLSRPAIHTEEGGVVVVSHALDSSSLGLGDINLTDRRRLIEQLTQACGSLGEQVEIGLGHNDSRIVVVRVSPR